MQQWYAASDECSGPTCGVTSCRVRRGVMYVTAWAVQGEAYINRILCVRGYGWKVEPTAQCLPTGRGPARDDASGDWTYETEWHGPVRVGGLYVIACRVAEAEITPIDEQWTCACFRIVTPDSAKHIPSYAAMTIARRTHDR